MTDHSDKQNEELLIEFDKQGSNWNKDIMPHDIFSRIYDIGHFLLNHNHPIIEQLKPVVFGKYKVVMKFVDLGYNNTSIWVNGRWVCMRKQRDSPVILNSGVKLIEGTPTRAGGSIKYPVPGFKEGYCILEFISHGLPMTNNLSGWKSELITLELFKP